MSDLRPFEIEAVEVIDVLSSDATMPGWRRDLRLVIVLTAVAGLMTFALTAHVLDRSPTTSRPLDEVGAVLPVVSPAEAHASPGGRETTLLSPIERSVIQGSTVIVQGRATHIIPGAAAEARIGGPAGLLLGRVAVGAIPPGPFSISLPVYAPSRPAVVEVSVAGEGREAPSLVSTDIVLSARFAVDVWSISTRTAGTVCQVDASGPATLTVGSVGLRLVDGTRTVASTVATVERDAGSSAANWLRLGRWSSRLRWAMSPDESGSIQTLRLEVAWTDSVAGTSSDLSVPFPACADRSGDGRETPR